MRQENQSLAPVSGTAAKTTKGFQTNVMIMWLVWRMTHFLPPFQSLKLVTHQKRKNCFQPGCINYWHHNMQTSYLCCDLWQDIIIFTAFPWYSVALCKLPRMTCKMFLCPAWELNLICVCVKRSGIGRRQTSDIMMQAVNFYDALFHEYWGERYRITPRGRWYACLKTSEGF